jgi:DNA-directed RNA polymerase subunit beta'
LDSKIVASADAIVQLRNCSRVTNSRGEKVIMSRNAELRLVDTQNRERARHRIPYGAKLLVEDKDGVPRGQRLAEWDPYTLPIITERDGVVSLADLVDGISMIERMDEATGIAKKVVVDWKQQPKGMELKPRIMLNDAQGNPIVLANGQEARYFLMVDAILSVENGQSVHAGDVLARMPRGESAKTRDITGGLPRVAELFEARRPKDFAIIAETEGRIEFGKDYKAKRRIVIVPTDSDKKPQEYLIPRGKHISVQEGDYVQVGDRLVDGNPVPHDILRVLGVEALATYLINEIQAVYRLQGVKINDKHIEVIVRQMLQKVEITHHGDTPFLVGELVDREEFDQVNAKSVTEGGQAAQAIPVLQGITKASLQTHSFISAASFQETTRVLTEAAVAGRIDRLIGLKENVIVGRPIPAGTGAVLNRVRRVALDRDSEVAAQLAADKAAAEQAAQTAAKESAPAPTPVGE